MFIAKRRLAPAVMACAVGISAGAARAEDQSGEALQQKISQLEAKVASLENKQAQGQADQAAATRKALSDADAHSQFLAMTPSGSGYDPVTGFHIGSDDGNFYLHPWVLFQFRGDGTYRSSVVRPPSAGEINEGGTNSQTGFEIRDLKFGLEGHLYSPNLKYFLEINTARQGGGLTLDDAYVTYRLSDNSPFTFKAGQFEDIAWHETNVDDGHGLAADRSLTNALIGGSLGTNGNDPSRVQGLSFAYQQGMIHAEIALHDGYQSANTKFPNQPGLGGFPIPAENFGISGRGEFKILGPDDAWSEYSQMSALNAKSDLLVAGVGYDWTEFGGSDAVFYTADVQYVSPIGLSVYGAFLGNYGQGRHLAISPTVDTYVNQYGLLVQAGYMLNKQWEVFGRWDYTHLDGTNGFADTFYGGGSPSSHNIHELTAGVNYYMYDERLRLTIDGTWLPLGCPLDVDSLGVLKDNSHNELIARVQLQLSI